jgi:hypothetical protein
MAGSTLYFAYTAMIDPSIISAVAPGAEFAFIAHLPETKLVFPHETTAWDGSLPSIVSEPGNTVWGAMFRVSPADLRAITAYESDEGRHETHEFKAVDREGKRHAVVTHAAAGTSDLSTSPSRSYMERIVSGGRHWSLPTGWVAGIEEYVEEPLI